MARMLYQGCETGFDVMVLQDGLNNACRAQGEGSAFGPLSVDGMFGPKTTSRVLEFQRRHKLTADGVVGSRTWGALETLLLTIPGLYVVRPLGGGGNPGTGPASKGSAYGKPASGKEGTGNGGKTGSGDDYPGKQTSYGGGKQSQTVGYGKDGGGGWNFGGGGKAA